MRRLHIAAVISLSIGAGCSGTTGAPRALPGAVRPEVEIAVETRRESEQLVIDTIITSRSRAELVLYPEYGLFECLSVATSETRRPIFMGGVDDRRQALFVTGCVDVVGVALEPGGSVRFSSRYDVESDDADTEDIEVATRSCVTYTDARCLTEARKVCSESRNVLARGR